MSFSRRFILAIFVLVLFTPQAAFAVGSGGFENASFSAASLARSNAVTADPDEPASISYNPAGITDLPGIQSQGGASFLSLMTYQKSLTTDSTTHSSGTLNFIPTSYLTINPGRTLNDRLAFGIGSDSPFGLANKYDANQSIVRYIGYNNAMRMFTVKPVVAVKVTNWLSLGGGPMYYRIFDYDQVLAYPNVILGGGADGQGRLHMTGNNWGWHFGALAKITPKHQVGFYFRSPIMVRLKGNLQVERSAFGGNFQTGMHAKLNLPLNMTWAYAYKPTLKTTYTTDFGYTRWSTLERVYVVADRVNASDDAIISALGNTPGPGTASDKDYTDAFNIHLGIKHKLNDKWTIRGGSAFYWTPVPKTSFTPVVADSNHLALSTGAGWSPTKNFTFDLSYFVIAYFRRGIDNQISESIGGSADGKYSSYVQSVTMNATYKWDGFGWGRKDDEEAVEIHGMTKSEKEVTAAPQITIPQPTPAALANIPAKDVQPPQVKAAEPQKVLERVVVQEEEKKEAPQPASRPSVEDINEALKKKFAK